VSNAISASGWTRLVEKSWPAVAAADLLSLRSPAWTQEGMVAPDEMEAVAWAAVGRSVRYGVSIAMNLPAGSRGAIPRLCVYLHRLRMDASQSLMRSPWFNAATMAGRTDLVVLGRPAQMLRDFATSAALRPTLLSKCAGRDEEGRHRTMLAGGHGDLMEVVQRLESCTSPFAIVLDATMAGCADNTGALVDDLSRRFPAVPLIALGYTGDAGWKCPAMHQWNMRLGDESGQPSSLDKPITIVSARDSVMDAFVKRLSFLMFAFRKVQHESSASGEQLMALRAVERAFRGLNVPFAVAERATASSRGGRFAVRPVARWIEIVKTIRAWRGDIETLLGQIVSVTEAAAERLGSAVPGRAQALLQIARQSIDSKQTIGILAGNRREAETLRRWLENELGVDGVNLVSVGHMDGAAPYIPERSSVLLYAAPLFPSRLHWLALPAASRYVLCYPFEVETVENRVRQWWQKYALPSSSVGDKCRLWALEWPVGTYLDDSQVAEPEGLGDWLEVQELPLDGTYPVPLHVVEIDPGARHAGWLNDLLAEPASSGPDDIATVEAPKDSVVVYLDGHAEPIRWPNRRQLLTLADDELVPCAAIDLKMGQDIVLMVSSEDRAATQRELFDMFVSRSYGLEQKLRIAEKWQEYVDAAAEAKDGAAGVTRYLKAQNYSITVQAVHHWIAGRVMGPQDPAAILLLAEAASDTGAQKMAPLVERAIAEIRGEHRRIGADLRKAIALSRSKGVAAVKIGTRTFPREMFDSMVEIARVARVDRPPLIRDVSQKTLRGIAELFANNHPERIVFTPACERSMSESPYENHSAFEDVLDVLVGPLFEMYSNKTVRLSDVEDRFAAIPAEYAGEMSPVTKGKFHDAYFRIWDGRRVDISRHIKLGRRVDPRYTMRIHFHWDETLRRIVVHHAGSHLPTARV
jgi:hypothetical protein